MGYSPIANRRVKTMVTKLMEVAIGNGDVGESVRKRKGKVDTHEGELADAWLRCQTLYAKRGAVYLEPVGAVG